MAWVREKNPKPKAPSGPARDPKESLEGLLSYLACKQAPNPTMQRYLREISPHKMSSKPEIVAREPTVYDEQDEESPDEDDAYEVASLRSERTRSHRHQQQQQQQQQHHHHHHSRSQQHSLASGGGGGDDDYDAVSLRSERTRSSHHHSNHHHHHHHSQYSSSPPPQPAPLQRVPVPRYVSNVEPRPYRPRTNVQARRVVSSWSNATTPLAI